MAIKHVGSVIVSLSVILTACGGNPTQDTITLKVWGPQQEQSFLFDAAMRYKEANQQLDIEYDIASVSEVEVKGFLTLDIPIG
ncbi:MAG: hypothetical protein ACO3C8_04375, partial [Bacilli bacterium]